MARSRFVRPEFFTDEKVGELPYGARLLFAGVWCQADLRGVFEHSPKLLRMQVFPYDEGLTSGTVLEWLQNMEALGMVVRFESGGKTWGHIRNWLKYQEVTAREVEIGSRRPVPPGWVDPSRWEITVENARKLKRLSSNSPWDEPRTVPEPTQNPTPTATPTATPTSSSSNARARDPDPADPLSMDAMQQAPEPAHVARTLDRRTFSDWRTMVAHRIYWQREEDEVWKGVFAAEGWDEMTRAYEHLAKKHPAPKKIFLSMIQDCRA